MRFLFPILFLALPASANYTLTVATAGPVTPGAIVTSTPSGIVCPATCSFSFPQGSTITLGEVIPSTMAFQGWYGTNGCATNQQSCGLVLNTTMSVTAIFDPLLAVSMSGNGLGVVTSTTGVNCTTAINNACANYAVANYAFAEGTNIILDEAAGSSSTFVGWTGDSGCSTASTCTITLNGYEHIVSTFTSNGPFTVDLVLIGSGTVTSSPSGIHCGSDCETAFSSGTTITFSTSASPGWYFAGWSNGGCSGTNTCVIVASTTYQGLGGPYSPSAFFYQP